MVAIIVKPSRVLEVVPHQGNWALKRYFTLNLDDRSFISQLHVTKLQIMINSKFLL